MKSAVKFSVMIAVMLLAAGFAASQTGPAASKPVARSGIRVRLQRIEKISADASTGCDADSKRLGSVPVHLFEPQARCQDLVAQRGDGCIGAVDSHGRKFCAMPVQPIEQLAAPCEFRCGRRRSALRRCAQQMLELIEAGRCQARNPVRRQFLSTSRSS